MKASLMEKKERVIAYVDGFNLYFGMKDAGFEAYKWLDLILLSKNLLKSNHCCPVKL